MLAQVFNKLAKEQRIWRDFFSINSLQVNDKSFDADFWNLFAKEGYLDVVSQNLLLRIVEVTCKQNPYVVFVILAVTD